MCFFVDDKQGCVLTVWWLWQTPLWRNMTSASQSKTRNSGTWHWQHLASVCHNRPPPLLSGQRRNLREPRSRRQVNRCSTKLQSRAVAVPPADTDSHIAAFLWRAAVTRTRRIYFWFCLISLKILHKAASWSTSMWSRSKILKRLANYVLRR